MTKTAAMAMDPRLRDVQALARGKVDRSSLSRNDAVEA